MGRVVIKNFNESNPAQFPALAGVSISGKVETNAVVVKAKRPILLWQHVLAPGAEIKWDKPPVGHLTYVLEGEADANGEKLASEGAFIVAHGGKGVLRAGSSPVTVLHFHRPDDYPQPPHKAGGCCHVLNKKQAGHFKMPDIDGYVFADSDCPTCENWFHMVDMHGNAAAGEDGSLHYHTEDEIIVVVGGDMMVGNKPRPRGTALAVDANTIYGFECGPKGLKFVNYRASEPMFGPYKPPNNPPTFSEKKMIQEFVRKTAAGGETPWTDTPPPAE